MTIHFRHMEPSNPPTLHNLYIELAVYINQTNQHYLLAHA